MLQTKLTPNLGSFIGIIESELDFAMEEEVPKAAEGWEKVSMYDVLLRIVARISARVFIGQPHCRNEEWLETSIKYSKSCIRAFPLRKPHC